MYPLDRTEPASRELDWLPAELKALRWTAAGLIWTGVGLAALGGVLASGGALLHVALLAAAGGAYGGHRASRSILLARLRGLARGDVELSRLAHEPDGELVHLSGRVRARTTLPGLLHGAPAVYRRLVVLTAGIRFVHEAAVDFDLVDERGEPIGVEVAHARLLAPDPDLLEYPEPRFFAAELPPSLTRVAVPRRGAGTISAAERLVRHGDPVEVLGYKSRRIDPTVENRLARDTPMRATLRSGRELPLLITPLGVAPESEI